MQALYLSDDLLRKIFVHLPLKDLCNSAKVCSRWESLISEEHVWKNFTLQITTCEQKNYRKFLIAEIQNARAIACKFWEEEKKAADSKKNRIKAFAEKVMKKKITNKQEEMRLQSVFEAHLCLYRFGLENFAKLHTIATTLAAPPYSHHAVLKTIRDIYFARGDVLPLQKLVNNCEDPDFRYDCFFKLLTLSSGEPTP